MTVFGLTGPTGAGKSSAAEELRRQGVYVADADKTAREVCSRGSECLKELCAAFGADIADENGELRRQYLAGIVFSDRKKLECLNAITHKYIDEAIRAELANADSELAAIDGAVIIGSVVEKQCRFIVSVIADAGVREKRITERDGISAESARSRMAAQPDDDFYIARSKYVIHNNDGQKELASQIEALIRNIKESDFEQVI